jgi:type IV secretory pathway VirB9-like protein
MIKTATAIAVILALVQTAIPIRAAEPAKRGDTKPLIQQIQDAAAPQSPPTARTVPYRQRDIVSVNAKIRFTTMIVLPEKEQILDFTCGDKEYWIINGSNNMAYVKPAKVGARTNLNLVTASGNIYSFLLTEVTETKDAEPDLKVFVEMRDEGMKAAAAVSPKFVPVDEIEEVRHQLAAAKEETRQAKLATDAAIENSMVRFINSVRFPYRFEAGKAPFFVRAMYHDDKFTYLLARPEEAATLYEIKDGKPNMINFTYKDGLYTASKIVDRGYLAIGHEKLKFAKED